MNLENSIGKAACRLRKPLHRSDNAAFKKLYIYNTENAAICQFRKSRREGRLAGL
jgi:hypothetical protein